MSNAMDEPGRSQSYLEVTGESKTAPQLDTVGVGAVHAGDIAVVIPTPMMSDESTDEVTVSTVPGSRKGSHIATMNQSPVCLIAALRKALADI
jgi:hypothetical protein